MKKWIFITLCIAGLFNCCQKRPDVIEWPVFEVRNSGTLEIDKIELSDTATVFHIDAYYWPNNWIRIDKETYIQESGTNNKLLITHSEGINLDEETYMPESGTISFKLFFPSLEPTIAKIDFIESDCENCFKIWGIHLLPNAKIKMSPVPNDIVNTTEPLPAAVFSLQPTQVSGQLSGYVNGMGPKIITIYTTNIINGERVETELPVSDDGTFSGEVLPGMPGIVYSSLGNLFLVPGQDMKIFVDLKKRSRVESRYRTDKEPADSINTYVSGYFSGSELNKINQATIGMFDYQQMMKDVVNMSPDEFKQYLLNIMNRQLNEINQKDYSINTQVIAENNIKLATFTFLIRYESIITDAYMQANNIKREDMATVAFKAEKPDDDYYSFLKGQLTDNMSYLPNFAYISSFLTDLFGLPNGNDQPAKEQFAYFKEKITPVLGADKGVLFDLAQIKYYSAQLNDLKFYSNAEKQEIRDAFKDKPVYAEALIAENDKMQTLLAANRDNKESILNELPQVSQEKMLDAILAHYRGKVVLVDFWATWCGPCMVAMKSILPMKEEMKGKDVVFLYLTGETSPLGTFTQTYPTIAGEHYRVSDAQWRYWMKTFDIQGIPTYMIYDRQGKQISKHLGFPGVETIQKNIEKAL